MEAKGQPALTSLLNKLRRMTNMPLNGMCYQRGGVTAGARLASDHCEEDGE